MTVRERYSHVKADAKKKQKRIEAEQRQSLRDSRSVAQQLQKLNAGGHAAVRERARLRGDK